MIFTIGGPPTFYPLNNNHMKNSLSLKGKILLLSLRFDECKKRGYRMLYVADDDFTRKDAFDWAVKQVDEVSGLITNLKII